MEFEVSCKTLEMGQRSEKGSRRQIWERCKEKHPTTWQDAGASEEVMACNQSNHTLLFVERRAPLPFKMKVHVSSIHYLCLVNIRGDTGSAQMEGGVQHLPNLFVLRATWWNSFITRVMNTSEALMEIKPTNERPGRRDCSLHSWIPVSPFLSVFLVFTSSHYAHWIPTPKPEFLLPGT